MGKQDKERYYGRLILVAFVIGVMTGAAIFMPRKHHWVEVSKSYQPGVNVTEVKWIDPDELHRLLWGYTAIRYRDTVTGDEKVETFTGDIK